VWQYLFRMTMLSFFGVFLKKNTAVVGLVGMWITAKQLSKCLWKSRRLFQATVVNPWAALLSIGFSPGASSTAFPQGSWLFAHPPAGRTSSWIPSVVKSCLSAQFALPSNPVSATGESGSPSSEKTLLLMGAG